MKGITKWILLSILFLAIVGTFVFYKKQTQNIEYKSKIQTSQAPRSSKAWVLTDSAMSNMTSFDPVKIVDAFSVNVLANVYEGLVNVSPEGRPVPGLAKSWEHSPDGKVWTFHLKKGVRFHPITGCNFHVPKEVTTKDVLYSFKRALSAPGAVTSWIFTDILDGALEFAKGDSKKITGLEVVDPYTIKIHLKRPYFVIPRLAFNGLWIYPASIVEKCGQDYLSSHEVGTGPYTLEGFVPDDRIVLERFKDYRQVHENAPEKVVIRIFSDPLAAMESFAAGELDIVEAELSTLPRAKKLAEHGNRLISVRANYLDYVVMNNKKAPFDDIRIRLALNMAIDRDALARQVLKGFGVPAYGFIPPFSPAFRGFKQIKKQGFQFNPSKARSLVKEYLEDKGEKALKLELVIDSGEIPETIGQFVKAQLENNLPGIDVRLKKITWPAMLQMAFGGKGIFYRMWWNIVTPGDDLYFLFYFPGQDPPHGFNLSFYESKKFLQEYQTAMAGLDAGKRDQGVRQLEDLMIKDAVAIPLLHKTFYFLEKKGISCPINGLLKKPYIYTTNNAS